MSRSVLVRCGREREYGFQDEVQRVEMWAELFRRSGSAERKIQRKVKAA